MKWTQVIYKGRILERYEVSDHGQIRNVNSGKILALSPDKDGYLRVGLHITSTHRVTVYVHRIVVESFHPDWLADQTLQVNHLNGFKDDNRLDNLEVCAGKDNVEHAILTGLFGNIGENCTFTKYEIATIHEICQLLEDGFQNKEISKKLGVPKSTVATIRGKKSWKSISKLYNINPGWIKKDDDTVNAVCRLISEGYTNTEIASMLDGINHKYVSLIRNGKRHKKTLDKYMGSTTIERPVKLVIEINLPD